MIIVLFSFAVAFALAAVAARGRLSALYIVALGAGQWVAGSWAVRDAAPRLLPVILSGYGAIYASYWFSSREAPGTTEVRHLRGLPVTVGLVVLAVGVHFLVAGIPLLGENVEVDRFALSSSGLYGIPSRMYLFGLPFLAVSLWVVHKRIGRFSRTAILMFLILALTRIGTGLKSGLLETMFIALLALIAVRGRRSLRELPWLRTIGGGVLASVAAILVATQYQTVDAGTPGEALAYLTDRLSTGTVSAAVVLIGPTGDLIEDPVLGDYSYYLSKYLFGQADGYTSGQQVSSALHGVRLDSGDYLSPVVLGSAPTLFAAGGLTVLISGALVLGWLLAVLERWGTSSSRAENRAAAMVLVLALTSAVSNGGFAYFSINSLGTLLIVLGTTWTASIRLSGVQPVPRGGLETALNDGVAP